MKKRGKGGKTEKKHKQEGKGERGKEKTHKWT